MSFRETRDAVSVPRGSLNRSSTARTTASADTLMALVRQEVQRWQYAAPEAAGPHEMLASWWLARRMGVPRPVTRATADSFATEALRAMERDGDLWQILDYHHIKMGRGSAQVRIKLRNIKRGQTVMVQAVKDPIAGPTGGSSYRRTSSGSAE